MTGAHSGPALAGARQRIAARPAGALVARHLQARYGIEVRGLSELDLGVYRIDRADGPGWVARVFPAGRPEAATAGDAEILAFLALSDFESERGAAPQPVSVIDGHTVLITELVTGVPRTERAAAIRAHGGLRRLGEMLGELHALPAGTGAVGRPGGAWHHLADGLPAAEIRAAQALLADSEDAVPARERPLHAALRRELADADGGEGLPQALLHPDFALANVIASPDRGMVLVDWTGAGRGPRAWSLAFLVFAEGARNPPRAGLVLDGYRSRVSLEPEEIDRLPALMRVRPVVLATWSYCLGRSSLAQAARAVDAAQAVAQEVGPRAVAALRARRE